MTRDHRLRELEALYRSRYDRFARVATAIVGDVDRAHEAVQDGFADAIRSRRTYRGDGPLEAWVWRAVVNAARKARDATAAPVVTAMAEPATNGTPHDDTGVRAWIATLPERQRLVVFLRYYADLDYRAIAAALDVEVGTVSATLSSAHTALRRALRKAES